MSILVRLYPASWRARYGDELEAILEDDPPSPYDTVDLLLGAIDAHLHLRGLGRRLDHRKGIPMSLRLAGSAAIAGGALWIVALAIAAFAAFANVSGDATPLFVLIFAAQLALVVALAGLSAYQAHRYPTLVWIAFLVPAAGVIASLAGMIGMAVRGDAVLVADFSGWYVWFIGMLATVGGSVLFGAVTYRTAAISRPGALVLTVGSAIAVVAIGSSILGLVPDGGASVLGGVAFGAGWIVLGRDALRRDAPVTAEPAA